MLFKLKWGTFSARHVSQMIGTCNKRMYKSPKSASCSIHWCRAVTDPGFPQGGGGGVNPPRGGREHAILPNSPKNCMKLKEFGRRGGGVRPSRPPLRSATVGMTWSFWRDTIDVPEWSTAASSINGTAAESSNSCINFSGHGSSMDMEHAGMTSHCQAMIG